MKRYCLSIISFFLLYGCTEKQKPKTFPEDSNVSSDLTSGKDSAFDKFNYQRFSLLLGEEGFLNAQDYDYYLIYAFANFGEGDQYYIIKSLKGIVTISKKVATRNSVPFLISKNDTAHIHEPLAIAMVSKIEHSERVLPFKKIVDKNLTKLHSKRNVTDIREFYSCIYYFNGVDYFYLNYLHLGSKPMKEIDSIFQRSELFRTLKE